MRKRAFSRTRGGWWQHLVGLSCLFCVHCGKAGLFAKVGKIDGDGSPRADKMRRLVFGVMMVVMVMVMSVLMMWLHRVLL